jgi:hypothetical protein
MAAAYREKRKLKIMKRCWRGIWRMAVICENGEMAKKEKKMAYEIAERKYGEIMPSMAKWRVIGGETA